MLPTLPRISRLIEQPSPHGQVKTINLARMGWLYIAASLVQSIWPYLIWNNWEEAEKILSVPFFAWPLIAIWVSMLWLIPHLALIGIQLIRISSNPEIIIVQTMGERSKMRTIALLLFLGILMDVVLVPLLMLQATDPGWTILLSGFIGGRVTQANLEAVLQYYRM